MNDTALSGLGGELRRLLAEAEGLLGNASDAAGDKFDVARDSLQRACGHLRAAERELASRARRVDAAVHAHPWETAAVAGIAGFLLGMLVRRK